MDQTSDWKPYLSYHRHSSFLPTMIVAIVLPLITLTSIISCEVSKVESKDKSHYHMSWFGKQLIYDKADGKYKSYHFMKPDSCEICKKVVEEYTNKK